jgi:hypothetical protein
MPVALVIALIAPFWLCVNRARIPAMADPRRAAVVLGLFPGSWVRRMRQSAIARAGHWRLSAGERGAV